MILSSIISFSSGQEAWIAEKNASVVMTGLTATIHVHIKNNNDHIEYFKISQQYFQTSPPINWTIVSTNPPADKMIKSVTPELGGDYGWQLQPGETKTVCFTLSAQGLLGDIPSYIYFTGSTPNQFWPLIPEPGLTATWFTPQEIEYLNPNLDLQLWQGEFSFIITNVDSKTVRGIVRAPIVPINSKLTGSSPPITYIDDDYVKIADTAAWDVCMPPGTSRAFCYVYQWPVETPTEPSHARAAPVFQSNNTTTPPTVPTRTSGVPYGLMIIAVLIVAAGGVYVKFIK